MVDAVEFATSPKYLNKFYLSVLQISILKAIYALPMARDELLKFMEHVVGGEKPNPRGYDEAVIVCGVRGGKTDFGSIVMVYEQARWGPVLARILQPGQIAKCIIIAQDERGAGEARGYIEGNFLTLEDKFGEVLAPTTGQARAITGKAIKTAWPVETVIYPAKKASTRGTTGLCGLLDEVAHWETAEGAYNQDERIIRAYRSRFATLSRLHPKRLMISSPEFEEGAFFKEYKSALDGKNSRTLVMHCPTWELNPPDVYPTSVTQEFLDVEEEKDPEWFKTEYGAMFAKGDGSNSFLPAEIIDKCVVRGRLQSAPKPGVEYFAFMDAAFKRDRFFFGIAHVEYDKPHVLAPDNPLTAKVVIDRVRHWTPRQVAKGRKAIPLDDREIVSEIITEELRPYGIDRIHGDQFADVPLQNHFKDGGIQFVSCPVSAPEKSEVFKNLRGALRAMLVELPDDPELIKDLKGLVKTQTSKGNISVQAPKRKGCFDDGADVAARLVSRLLPLSGSVDLSAFHTRAMPKRFPGQDWRERDPDADLGTGLMEAVY